MVRNEGYWQTEEAQENGKTIILSDDEEAVAYSLSTLDVPGIAAFTNVPNIRFDFGHATSI